MFEFLAFIAALTVMADAERQQPLPLASRGRPLLPQRLQAGEYHDAHTGERRRMRPWTVAERQARAASMVQHGKLPYTYYASGSNRPTHIRGMWRIGMNVGVAAQEVSPAAVDELKRMGHTQLEVFVDSGAFEEFTAPQKIANLRNRIARLQAKQAAGTITAAEERTLANAPKRLAKMERTEWEPDWEGTGRAERTLRPVLPLYEALVGSIGEWLHVVAPDKIGDQAESLNRMRRYGPRMVELARQGAEVLVPLQWGDAMTLGEFEEQALQAMVVPPELLYKFVPAMPLKAAALPWADVIDYVRRWKPRRVHLLGVGPKRRAETGRPSGMEMVAEILALSPRTDISMDASLLSATLGKGGGPAKGPRQLTLARDIMAEEGWTPSELQELAMVVAWPELYLAHLNRVGARHGRVMPGPLPERLPVDRYVAAWSDQLERGKQTERATAWRDQIEAEIDRLRRRYQGPDPDTYGWLFRLSA